MEADISKLFQKTYINPKLLPLTRNFTDKEIKDWLEEDKLE